MYARNADDRSLCSSHPPPSHPYHLPSLRHPARQQLPSLLGDLASAQWRSTLCTRPERHSRRCLTPQVAASHRRYGFRAPHSIIADLRRIPSRSSSSARAIIA